MIIANKNQMRNFEDTGIEIFSGQNAKKNCDKQTQSKTQNKNGIGRETRHTNEDNATIVIRKREVGVHKEMR